MKKIFKKFGLSLAAMACVVCAGFGVALGFSKDVPTAKAATITELPDSDYYIASAGLRLINDADGAALRFNTNLIADQYDNVVESGTLIIPEVRYDGQLTLDDLNNAAKYQPAHVVTKGKVNGKDVDLWYDFGEVGGDTFMRTTAYLYDIPEVWYGARMIAVSYIKDANGNIKYTTVLDEVDGVRMNRYSMSDVASRFANSAEYADRVAPYIVDEVTLTYAMPDGSKQSETVAYGSKVSEISFDYNKSAYAFLGFEDQYGRTLDLANEEITLPLTLTPVFKTLQGENVVFNNMITDDYAADNTYRAFNNSTNPDVITADVPEGYSAIYSYEAFGESQSFWKANGNPLYRSAYNDIDISGYDLIRFAMKVTTDGDAGIAVYPVLPNGNRVDTQVAKWIRNEWVEVQLEQTAANTWKMTLTNLTTGELIHKSVEYTRNANAVTDVDSVSSLVFMACKWDSQTPTLFVMPGSEATMKSSVQFTEVLGYNELDYAPSVDSTVVADSGFKTGYGLTAAEADGETVPAGFSSVSKYMTDTSKWTASALNSTVYSSDITAYEELWVAYKITGTAYWKMHNGTNYNDKVRLNGTNAWVNYHLIQTSDSTWTIEARIRGALVAKAEGVSGNNIHSILWRSGYSNGFLIYSTDYTKSVPFYATEVRGILKDGVTLPDTDVDFDPEIPDNALVVRSYTWRDDKYALSASTTESAPVGYQNVVEFNWLDNPKNWAETAKDFPDWAPANDLSAYSDVYYAMKYVTDSGMVYNRGGAHYTGSDWLYVHLKQDMSEHTWSLSVKSPDGYEMVSSRTSTAMNLKSLMAYGELGFYPNKTITGDNIATKAIAYFTEMLAVPVAMEMGERAIWSAVDKAVPTNDGIGIPAGFTSLYKYTNFTMDKFASMDLSNTVYEELSFGMLASVDFTFDTGYKYVSDGSEVTTSIMYNTGSRPQMYVVYLTNGGNGNWTITMNVRRWTPVGQIADTETFSANVTGNSIQEIMDKVLSPATNMTLYVTEVRGSHTCKYGYTDSLGNGYLQNYCACGEKIGDMYPFAHGIDAEATEVNDSIWRDDNYALSTPDQVAPVGFKKIEMYDWLHNTTMVDDKTGTGNMIPYGSNANDMPLTCLDEALIEGYKEVYFAIKLVGGDGIFVGNGGEYFGNDWLYVHYSKDMNTNTWSLSVRAADGTYTKENVQTGISVQLERLDELMKWGYLGADNSGSKGLYPTKTVENTVAKVYFTEILGIIACEHTTYEWKNNEYACANCGEFVGAVNTSLEKQTFALYKNATLDTFKADADHNITITGITTGTFENVTVNSVALNGVALNGVEFANGSLTISGIKAKDVFGEYMLTANITIEGKDFTITAPILVVTDLITTNEGLLNVRKILRGADSAEPTATIQITDKEKVTTTYRQYGGQGGEGTMNGDGYYMLGANITMSEIIIGEHNTENYSKQTTYVFGTLTVPFVGTFDGAGYVLDNYKSVKSPYNAPNGKKISLVQDVSNITAGSVGTTYENEPSLFGYMNGLVKNLAITNAQFGQYGNIVLCGNGTIENFYLDVANLQATRYNNAGENLTAIVAPLLQRAYDSNVTMRNVVVDLADTAFSGTDATISTHYPSLIGPGLGKAENVAVYGFDKAWINADDTRGNVYMNSSSENVDGSAAGIYVEYVADEEGNISTNGARFLQIMLDDSIWKIVDGRAYLKRVNVSGTVINPSDDSNIIEGGTGYNLVWNDNTVGAFDAISFINNTTNTAIEDGALGANVAILSGDNWSNTQQIIVGSYENYARYISDETLGDINYNGLAYGVYKVGNTIFVLAESEEGLMLAAKELCRQLYNYNQYMYTYLAGTGLDNINIDSATEVDIDAVTNYTTYITFAARQEGNTLGDGKDDMGANAGAPYTDFISMHNAANFFGVHSSSEATSVDVEVLNGLKDGLSFVETKTFATTLSNALITNSEGVVQYQVCYTAHGDPTVYWNMVDRVVNVVKAKKEANPNMTMMNFMVEDNTAYCQCTQCANLTPSVTQLLFLNTVQRELNANRVGVGIEFFAYNGFSKAPVLTDAEKTKLDTLVNTLNGSKGSHQTITVPTDEVEYPKLSYTVSLDATVMLAEEGLRLWWTSHEMNHSFPMDHVANAHIYPSLIAWIKAMGAEDIDVFMYQATYRDFFIPLNTWEYQVTWYQKLHELGITSFMFNLGIHQNKANTQTGFGAFKAYIDSRAMTDVNVTFDQLKQEFFGYTATKHEDGSETRTFNNKGYYGAGGEQMLQFFNELVAVYEGHKQGEGDAWIDTTTTNVQISTTGGTTGYIATWLYNNNNLWYNSSTFPNYYTCARQGFFNGSYGWDMSAMVFGGVQTSRTNVTPRNDLYKYGSLSQQATLERWYKHCTDALGKVSEDSTYADRIKVEALFPEYAFLVYCSTYTTTAVETTAYDGTIYKDFMNSIETDKSEYTQVTGYVGEVSAVKADSTVITKTYQEFYNNVKTLGVVKPSEFYTFDYADPVIANCQTYKKKNLFSSSYQDQGIITTSFLGTSATMTKVYGSYALYQSFYMNWGVTF